MEENMAKKGLIIVGLLASLAAAGYGAWQFYFKDRFAKRTDDSTVAYVTRVERLTPENLGMENWFTGVVEAEKTRNVSIESGRSVSEVKVSVGDIVHPGDLLFEYDLAATETALKQARLDYNKLVDSGKSMAEEITSLEKSYWEAQNANEQLSISLDMESRRMDQKKNEYQVMKKLEEIEKLQASMENTQVLCDMEGVVQKIDTSKLTSEDGDTLTSSVDVMSFDSDDSSENTFLTILSTGDYRVKGQVNEQNRMEIIQGERVKVRSRARQDMVWTGILGSIDEQGGTTSSEDNFFGETSNSQTNTTIYPFYVTLDNSDGLNLGEHVYIELDHGRSERAAGLWLLKYYIQDADSEAPYVWAADETEHLEKRMVTLGEFDAVNQEYQILDGLTADDYIAFPDDGFAEGIRAVDSTVRAAEEEPDTETGNGQRQSSQRTETEEVIFTADEEQEGSWQIDETPEDIVLVDEAPQSETPEDTVLVDEGPEPEMQEDGIAGMISDEDELAFAEEYGEAAEEDEEAEPEEFPDEEDMEENHGPAVIYGSDDKQSAG